MEDGPVDFVGEEEDGVLAAEVDDLLEVVGGKDGAGGILRVVDDQELSFTGLDEGFEVYN